MLCLCTVLLDFDLSFCRGGVWCMQDYVSIMSLSLYFVLRMSSRALVFLVSGGFRGGKGGANAPPFGG